MTDINTEGLAREIGVDEAVVSDVVARLLLVRGDLTDSGFHRLVRDVVRTKARFAQRDPMEDLSAVRIGPLVD